MDAIKVKNVHKKFKVFYDKGQSLKERLLFKNRNHYEDRWVLKGISFTVRQGEAIGLIGENGCGKSTLLKLMTKIMYPDEGSIEIEGRVSSLIELGAGFHPDMSGRENIYTNAAIFGLSRKEIDSRVEKIIRFSELEEFIDNPVRTYSSGMYMRLAFAVAINVDADVLLIDEILAVGDASFQAKCFNKLREIKASGTTIVIVSHSLGQIEQICDCSIWIDQGIIRRMGIPREIHPEYMDFMGKKVHQIQESDTAEEKASLKQEEAEIANDSQPEAENNGKRWGNKDAEIVHVCLENNKGESRILFKTGEQVTIKIQYKMKKELQDPVVGIGIFRNDEVQCYGTNTLIDNIPVKLNKEGTIFCSLEKNYLLPGEYMLDVAIHAEDGFAYDYIKDVIRFNMYSDIADAGVTRIEHTWGMK